MKSLALTAATQFTTIDGKKRAYRQFGTGEHLVLVNRFRGILDTWDPFFRRISVSKYSYDFRLFGYWSFGRRTSFKYH
jgi:hypothetical protein